MRVHEIYALLSTALALATTLNEWRDSREASREGGAGDGLTRAVDRADNPYCIDPSHALRAARTVLVELTVKTLGDGSLVVISLSPVSSRKHRALTPPVVYDAVSNIAILVLLPLALFS